MSNYIKTTNFAIKDSLITGDPAKIVRGTEIDVEFSAIQTAVATKADTSSPVFIGSVTFAGPVSFTGVTSVFDDRFFVGAASDSTKKLRFEIDTSIPTSTTIIARTGQGGILPAGIGPLPYSGLIVPPGWLECPPISTSLVRTDYPALFAAIGTTWGAVDASHFNLPPGGRIAIGDGAATYAETIASQTAVANSVIIATNLSHYFPCQQIVVTGASGFTGLINGTYYAIPVDATHLSFASSLANAIAGTVLTIAGTGIATLTTLATNRTVGQRGGEDLHMPSISEMPIHTHVQNAHTHTVGANNASAGLSAVSGTATGGVSQINDISTVTVINQNTGGGLQLNVMPPFIVTKMIISY